MGEVASDLLLAAPQVIASRAQARDLKDASIPTASGRGETLGHLYIISDWATVNLESIEDSQPWGLGGPVSF